MEIVTVLGEARGNRAEAAVTPTLADVRAADLGMVKVEAVVKVRAAKSKVEVADELLPK